MKDQESYKSDHHIHAPIVVANLNRISITYLLPYYYYWPINLLFSWIFSGLKEKCVDSLVFETLIPKPMMQHYISLLLKHRRLILSGPSGTGKSYLATRLAEYLVDRSAREVTSGIVVTFNMHRQSCKVWERGVFWESVQHSDTCFISLIITFIPLRICNFIFPIWPITSTGSPAHQKYRWLLFWMISMTQFPLANLSMVLLPANIINGTDWKCLHSYWSNHST